MKVLGITSDRENIWNIQFKNLRKVSLLQMNILKILAHTSSGKNSIILIQTYTSLILSKLEYDSFLFFNSKPSSLKMIDTVHNLGHWLAFGTFQSSLNPSLLNISCIPLLSLIKKTIMLLSARRAQNHLDTHHGLITEIQESNFKYFSIINYECPFTPSWNMDITIYFNLSSLHKRKAMPWN